VASDETHRTASLTRAAVPQTAADITAVANVVKSAFRAAMGRRLKSVLYAATAGICGSSAGTFGKIGMDVDDFFGINDQVNTSTTVI